jgi:hypothetical protein
MPTTRSLPGTDLLRHADIIELEALAARQTCRTVVSLHAHTNLSRESVTLLPSYLDRIPVIGAMARREMRAYEQRNGRPIDFTKGWWHPPVTANQVLASESAQIERLGLRPLVSITDHDSVDAGLSLIGTAAGEVPISFEWTVPYGRGFLHLGIHNLPRDTALAVFATLETFTSQTASASLADMLDLVTSRPETLVVLNHPLWDLAGVGADTHLEMAHRFVRESRCWLHAIELNGYRSWEENAGAADFARACGLPVISGGDRHGCAPNSLLNVTNAASFAEFVAEVRDDAHSVVLLMPEYREPLVARKMAVAADVMRANPSHPAGQPLWTDRISYEDDGVIRPLSAEWPDGGPLWARSAIRLFEASARDPWVQATRVCVWLAGASRSTTAMRRRPYRPAATSSVSAPSPEIIG